MITRTLDDLQAPDELTQRFTRFGLATTHMLTPESAVAYQHELLAGTDLVDEVAEGTRRSFERLRTVYIYGVLEYESQESPASPHGIIHPSVVALMLASVAPRAT